MKKIFLFLLVMGLIHPSFAQTWGDLEVEEETPAQKKKETTSPPAKPKAKSITPTSRGTVKRPGPTTRRSVRSTQRQTRVSSRSTTTRRSTGDGFISYWNLPPVYQPNNCADTAHLARALTTMPEGKALRIWLGNPTDEELAEAMANVEIKHFSETGYHEYLLVGALDRNVGHTGGRIVRPDPRDRQRTDPLVFVFTLRDETIILKTFCLNPMPPLETIWPECPEAVPQGLPVTINYTVQATEVNITGVEADLEALRAEIEALKARVEALENQEPAPTVVIDQEAIVFNAIQRINDLKPWGDPTPPYQIPEDIMAAISLLMEDGLPRLQDLLGIVALEERLGLVEERLDQLDDGLLAVSERINEVDERVSNLEVDVQDLARVVREQGEEIARLRAEMVSYPRVAEAYQEALQARQDALDLSTRMVASAQAGGRRKLHWSEVLKNLTQSGVNVAEMRFIWTATGQIDDFIDALGTKRIIHEGSMDLNVNGEIVHGGAIDQNVHFDPLTGNIVHDVNFDPITGDINVDGEIGVDVDVDVSGDIDVDVDDGTNPNPPENEDPPDTPDGDLGDQDPTTGPNPPETEDPPDVPVPDTPVVP